MQRLIGASSPHVKTPRRTSAIMLDVVIALLPAAVMGVVYFGTNALLQMVVAVAAAIVSEALMQRALKKPVTINDFSAVITGLLVAFNVPAGQGLGPLLICAVGSAFAIIVVKQLFGGLGHNFMNPALAARAFLMASWPKLMTSFGQTAFPPHMLYDASVNYNTMVGPASLFNGSLGVDVLSGPTPLAIADRFVGTAGVPAGDYLTMFLGNVRGCIGEVCTAALLVGAIYLLIRGVISWRIPIMYLLVFSLLTLIPTPDFPLQSDVPYQLLSGGLILGAFFMATDYSSSPTTPIGQLIMGAGCGILTFVIRRFGAIPEGVSYSILLMNVATPLIERMTRPRRFGHPRKEVTPHA